MKKSIIAALSIVILMGCKDNELDPKPIPENITMLSTSVDGASYEIDSADIAQSFYIDDGQTNGALEIQANLEDAKSLAVFVDELKEGTITLSQSYPAQMSLGNGKSNTITLGASNAEVANSLTSYIKYINAATSYFAVSGTISITMDGNDAKLTWDVEFKDATGKVFKSTGSSTIVSYKKNTKPRSQIGSPTSAVTITGISPDCALEGTEVTLTGTGFSAVASENKISFGGASITPISVTANQLKFIVPQYISVNKPAIEVDVLGSKTTYSGFAYTPKIHSFSPSKAEVGTTVEIFGFAFPEDVNELEVKIGDVVATVKESHRSYAKITVPAGAKTGKISVGYKGKCTVLSEVDFEVAEGTVAGANSVPIGRSFSDAASVDFKNENAVVDYFSGEHPVAIYKTPDGKNDEIGKGKLAISRSGNTFTMKLIGTSGATLAEANVDLTNDNDYKYETLSKGQVGPKTTYILSIAENMTINMTAYENGAFYGEAYINGKLHYRYRNNVEYFGITPPAAIASLTGTWEGEEGFVGKGGSCGPNPIKTVFAADGTITLNGKRSSIRPNACTDDEVTNKWDGQDDYVEANNGGFGNVNIGSMIYIDASAGAGSGGGGIWILVPALANPSSILEIMTPSSGINNGYIFVEKPTKK